MSKLLLLPTILIISFLSWNNVSSQCSFTIDLTDDFTICDPQNVDLSAIVSPDPLIIQWSDENGPIGNTLDVSAFVDETTTFTFSAFTTTSNNLVFNGDFELGDTGFTSGYLLGDLFCPFPQGPLWCEGMYTVSDDPSAAHQNFDACDDHTSGTGQMLIANGSNSFVDVWCQDVVVNPNTNYQFSAWAASVEQGSPAILQFTINGSSIGDNFDVNFSTCIWENFTAIWNSGSSTNATICIENQNLATGGNDFAIDDIEFIETCEDEETVTITIGGVEGGLQTSYSIDCDFPEAELSVIPSFNNYTYNWSSQFGGEIIGSTDTPNVTAVSSGLYTVTVTSENGCTETFTTSVNGSTEIPETAILGDFVIECSEENTTVFSTNNSSNLNYNWENNTSNGPVATYEQPGDYVLTITNQFNCSSEVDFTIFEIEENIQYDLEIPDTLSCIGDNTNLVYSSNQDNNFEWFDPNGNSLGTNDTIIVNDIGEYTIEIIASNGCTTDDTVTVISQISQLDYLLGESPTLTCNNEQAFINVEVNTDFSDISWFNPDFLASGDSILVTSSGDYIVEISDINGCITRDTLVVLESFETPIFSTSAIEIDCATGIGSAFINSSETYEVNWELPDGSMMMGDSISTNIDGEFIVTAINDIGCITSDTIQVDANQDFPSITVELNDINCASPIANITLNSSIDGTGFSWVGPNGFTSDEAMLNVGEAGSYIYEATSPAGCIVMDSVNIQGDFEEPSLIINALDTFDCNTSSIEIAASSNATFTFGNLPSNVISSADSTLIISQSNQVILEIVGENGCIKIDSIELISDFSTPAAPFIPDLLLDCNSPDSLLVLSSSQDINYTWSNGIDEITGLSYLINSMGTYNLNIESALNGCDTSISFQVIQDIEAAVPELIKTDINCIETNAIIEISSSQEITDITFPSDITDNSNQSYETQTAGIKEFIITYSNGCTIEASTIIEIDTVSPILSAVDYTFACMKEPLALVVNYDIDSPEFLWEGPDLDNSTEEFIITAISGDYQVTVTNSENGCSAVQVIQVFDNSTYIQSEIDIIQPLCFGDLPGIELTNNGGTEPYIFELMDAEGNPVFFDEVIAGTYDIHVIDYFGCDTSYTFTINEVFPFSIETGDSYTIVKGADAQLTADTDLEDEDIMEIIWSPSAPLSCNDCLNPTANGLTEDTWFTVNLIDKNGCVETDSILIRIIIEYEIYIPNVFTPDVDGNNDNFQIFSNIAGAEIEISDFRIYDRWGNRVHEEERFNLNSGGSWDGMHHDKPASQGVYAYTFKALYPEGNEEVFSGTITLIR